MSQSKNAKKSAKSSSKTSTKKAVVKLAKKAPVKAGRVPVTIEGVEYKSRSEAAKALIAAGKSMSETAAAVGMTYQTVYAVTKGADKVVTRRIKYRAVKLGATGRYSEGMLAEKLGTNPNSIRAMVKAAGISLPKKEELDKAEKAAEAAAIAAKETAKAEKESAKATKRAEKDSAKKIEAEAVTA